MEKVLIDVNIWISLLLTKNIGKLIDLTERGNLMIYADKKHRDEFLDVIHRKKFKKYYSKDEINETVDIFDSITEQIIVSTGFTGSPDPKDDYLFDLAKQSGAKYLVTGDKKLLEFKFPNLEIITMNEFFEKF